MKTLTPLMTGLLLALASGLVPSSAVGAPKRVAVFGWPVLELKGGAPPSSLGDDPVVGRLACPPISRLDLQRGKPDPLLIRNAERLGKTKGAEGETWRYEIRTGIYWWSGEEVTSADLAAYLEKQMSALVDERGAGLWSLPPFEVRADDERFVSVTWKRPPSFGPYVVNGAALWRSRPAKKGQSVAIAYECAGIYEPHFADHGLTLKPNPGYGGARPVLEVWTGNSNTDFDEKGRQRIEFRRGASFGGSPWARMSDEAAECNSMVSLPYVSLVAWNHGDGPTRNADFRHILTMLAPRGALLRSGSAYLGALSTGLIPRSHPGSDPKLRLRPFDAHLASEALDKLGYRRKRSDSPRLTPKGEPLTLRIVSPARSSGLVEKVLTDSLASVGIKALYSSDRARFDHVDGIITGVRLDWPEADLLADLHSKSKSAPMFWRISDPALDKALESYALTLTEEDPKLDLLGNVQRRLYEIEPFTVLLQHKACLVVTEGKAPKVTVEDPDWFRRLVL